MKEIEEFIEAQGIDTSAARWRTSLPKPPQATFDPSKSYYWQLATNKGEIRIKLLTVEAPMHVSSTIFLTQLGFYDGLSFHRVIQGFMAQGGCPLGQGTGGPGYEYDGEFFGDAKHDAPGKLSMANRGPGTDGSQFFLTFVPTPHLDGNHTVFGEVVDGMDTVESLEQAGSGGGEPREPLSIERATIVVE
jgi:cyclophilin family peptidyl-prolyl cis-trans isomerase